MYRCCAAALIMSLFCLNDLAILKLNMVVPTAVFRPGMYCMHYMQAVWKAMLDVNHVGYPCPKPTRVHQRVFKKQRVSINACSKNQRASKKRCVFTTTRVQKAMRVHHQRAFIDAVQKAICVSKMDANGAKWPKIDSKWTQMDTFQ